MMEKFAAYRHALAGTAVVHVGGLGRPDVSRRSVIHVGGWLMCLALAYPVVKAVVSGA